MSRENHPLFFERKINDRLIAFTDVSGSKQYLLIGNEKAALIDTGYGCGDLKGLVKKHTDKPIVVLITHAHRDHAMGAGPFGAAYMSPLDNQKYLEDCGMEIRKKGLYNGSLRPGATGLYEYVEESDWHEALALESFKPMLPGDTFDLGGQTIEVLEGAGHSDGCVMLLFKDERLLLAGDACNDDTRIWTSVEDYMHLLKRVQRQTEGKFDKVIFSHGDLDAPPEFLQSMITLCEEILLGTDDRLPLLMRGKKMLQAKATDPQKGIRNRVDGGMGNIIYDPERIRS